MSVYIFDFCSSTLPGWWEGHRPVNANLAGQLKGKGQHLLMLPFLLFACWRAGFLSLARILYNRH